MLSCLVVFLLNCCDKLVGIDSLLPPFLHPLHSEGLVCHFLFSCDDHNGDVPLVGIFHLFLNLGCIRVNLSVDAVFANLVQIFQTITLFVFAEVEEDDLGAFRHGLGEEFQTLQNVIDAVGTETDAYPGYIGESEDTGEVVVTSSAGDATYREVLGFHLEDGPRVIVETTCQSKVEFGFNAQVHVVDVIEKGLQFFNAFLTDFVVEHRLELLQLFFGISLHEEDGLQLLYGSGFQPFFGQLCVDSVDADFV